jgi:hypothetical protein
MKTIFTPRSRVIPPPPGIANPRWGYRWEIGTLLGQRVIYTYFDVQDYLTVNMVLPEAGVTVIIMGNDVGNDLFSPALQVARAVLGKRIIPATARISPLPARVLGTYTRTLSAANASHEPFFKSIVGDSLSMTIEKGSIHLVLPGGPPTDEYYHALSGDRFAMTRFLPSNENDDCGYLPAWTPPTGYFAWSLRGHTLSIRTINDPYCLDRWVLLSGQWTKTS